MGISFQKRRLKFTFTLSTGAFSDGTDTRIIENAKAHVTHENLANIAAALPEVSQIELMRHYTQLSHKTFGVDEGFYPLGSCTMKYNPKINEVVARYVGLSAIHPYPEADTVQGALEVLYKMEEKLAEIAGMDAVTLEPAAGAHGELDRKSVV